MVRSPGEVRSSVALRADGRRLRSGRGALPNRLNQVDIGEFLPPVKRKPPFDTTRRKQAGLNFSVMALDVRVFDFEARFNVSVQ